MIEENQIHNLEDQLLLIEQKTLLPEYYFIKTDRASMYASFELRSLYTSKKLYEFVNKIKANQKFTIMKIKFLKNYHKNILAIASFIEKKDLSKT